MPHEKSARSAGVTLTLYVYVPAGPCGQQLVRGEFVLQPVNSYGAAGHHLL